MPALIALDCSTDRLAGTGTETSTKGIVMGALYGGGGKVAPHAAVVLVPQSYNPLIDAPLSDVFKDTTDNNGNYIVGPVDTGSYNLEAAQVLDGTKLFRNSIAVAQGDNKRGADTLGPPGAMVVTLPMAVTSTSGSLYFQGSTIAVPVNPSNASGGSIRVDSLPPGLLSALYYTASVNSVDPVKIADGVTITSSVATPVVGFSALWKFSKKLYLNTTASGAHIYGTVRHFPVLIRLTNANFIFGNAKSNGEDVRFVTSSGAPMAYQIERWDPAAQRAELWVSVDTIFGNDSSRYFIMFWGNTEAQSASDGSKVFDTANGFQAVWHLNQMGTDSILDATANHFNGVSVGRVSTTMSAGAIGAGKPFDGLTNYISVPNSASGKLNFQENGHYTISTWVNADSLDNAFHQILSKGDRQYGMQIHNINQWEIMEYDQATGWQSVRSPATAGRWKFVVGVRDGAVLSLYVDGALTSNWIISRADSMGRDTTSNVSIGRQSIGFPRYFNGMIDEVCMANTVRSSDWITLCYMNQKEYNTLIVFK
jgi:hypothetical protein